MVLDKNHKNLNLSMPQISEIINTIIAMQTPLDKTIIEIKNKVFLVINDCKHLYINNYFAIFFLSSVDDSIASLVQAFWIKNNWSAKAFMINHISEFVIITSASCNLIYSKFNSVAIWVFLYKKIIQSRSIMFLF